MFKKKIVLSTTLILFSTVLVNAQRSNSPVKVIGAMQNVFAKGQLHGLIYLDTIPDRSFVYGLGPHEYLSGELMMLEGVVYFSKVFGENEMVVSQNAEVESPSFAYAQVYKWNEYFLPDSIRTLTDLETYLDSLTNSAQGPFLFKLAGTVSKAKFEVLNLPKGNRVSVEQDAYVGRKFFELEEEEVDILGFFSREHKGIFTPPDAFLHLHVMTKNKEKMGHLDQVVFKKGAMKLYLPAN